MNKRPWHSYYSPETPVEIDPDQYGSLLEWWEQCCAAYADQIAFSNFGTRMTYRTLDQKSRCFAAYLQQHLKLKAGETVAIMLPNLLQYPVVLLGILRAGLIAVSINPLSTAPELTRVLLDSEARTIVVLSNFAKTVEAALLQVPLKNIILTELGDLLGGMKRYFVNFVIKRVKRKVPSVRFPYADRLLDTLLKGSHLSYQRPELKGQDIAFLQYTGGTTGQPKAAVLTHRNILANILQCSAWVQTEVIPGRDIVLAALPMYHILSLMVSCLTFMSLGLECLLITNPRDIKAFLKVLSKVPVTIFIGLNTLLRALMHHHHFPKADFSRLKLTVTGGMATQAVVAQEWQDKTGVPVLQGYGLTEASPVVSMNPITLETFSESVGIPMPSTDVMIRSEAGEPLPTGEIGELCVKGPQVVSSYWKQPEATAELRTPDGWLLTGDLARMDEKGFIYLVDRKKDMILVSGFNVYPAEVEATLVSHPNIEEAAVVGVPNEETGEAVVAFVVVNDEALSVQAMMDYCRLYLMAYKVPVTIEYRKELPKTSVGKTSRHLLRESYMQ